MPLLYFIGVTYIDTSFSIAFCLIAEEIEVLYQRIVTNFKSYIIGNSKIIVILTNNKDALKHALSFVYPIVLQLLYFQHIEKRVLIKIKSLQRVNNVNMEINKANKKKKEEFIERQKQTSLITTNKGSNKESYSINTINFSGLRSVTNFYIQVTYTKTEVEFEDLYKDLKNTYSDQPLLIKYLNEYKYLSRQ